MTGRHGRTTGGAMRLGVGRGSWCAESGVRTILLASLLVMVSCSLAVEARASASEAAAAADSLANAAATDTTTTDTAAADTDSASTDGIAAPFFASTTSTPKVGAKADVRLYSYYGELVSDVKMRRTSKFTNTFSWNWEDYRKTDKTVERRSDSLIYNSANCCR